MQDVNYLLGSLVAEKGIHKIEPNKIEPTGSNKIEPNKIEPTGNNKIEPNKMSLLLCLTKCLSESLSSRSSAICQNQICFSTLHCDRIGKHEDTQEDW